MAGWAKMPKTKEVQHNDGRASSSGSQQAVAVKMEELTVRVNHDTAKKNGWTPEMQTVKLASSLRGMRLSVARLLNDEHEMRKMAKNNISGFEIDELFEYLNNNGIAQDLLYSIARVRGDLDEICYRIHQFAAPGVACRTRSA